MEDLNLYTLAFLVLSGFLAAFIDSVVGGGGLISIPALLFTGLPPSTAIATNKLASSMGALTSTISFIKSGKVNFRLVSKLFPLTVIGSFFGAYVVKHISSQVLKPLVLVLLITVAIYTILKKDWGKDSTYEGMNWKRGAAFAVTVFIIGFYDGFFGAGTGSFLLFFFLMILYLDIVNFSYGIPMGIAMILGALVGSNFAIKKGVSYVRILFIAVTLFLIGKNILDYLHLI